MPRPTVAEIDLSAIAHNLRVFRSLVGPTVEIFGIVKADAYGHGAVPVSRALAAEGVRRFAVALVEEGAALQEAGVPGKILVLGALLPEQAPEVAERGFEAALSDLDFGRRLDEEARRRGKRIGVHLKFDTGMGRLGFPADRALEIAREMAALSGLRLEGAMTHFPVSDERDGAEFTGDQIRRFLAVRESFRAAGIRIPVWHCANSGALLLHPESHLDAVRPGIALYGGFAAADLPPHVQLRRAMTLKTRIVLLRDFAPGHTISYGRTFRVGRPSRIAVLPIGYADGFHRANSNTGCVLIRGQRAPVVGRVCMDMTMADATDVPGAAVGDEVVIYGRQGAAEISLVEAASRLGTVPHELMTGLTARVPRVPLNAG